MILHYANLAVAAGGVDAFLIGSELKALTLVRSAPGLYPAVSELVALANDVKAILGDTIVTYGADWTEYGAHVADAQANEVRFPLDPLWAAESIDVIGIDYYAPFLTGGTHPTISTAPSRARFTTTIISWPILPQGKPTTLLCRRGCAGDANASADHR